ncbi:MAG: hypothetical protein IJ848_00695 [Alphaproteobacteria bacterium]|nr:hypothetical protein [Alphaproteobacteria bacterium]
MQLVAVFSRILERIRFVLSKISEIQHSKYINFDKQQVIIICDSFIAVISLFISIQLRIGVDSFDSSFLLFNNLIVFGLVSASIFSWLKINNNILNNINKLLLAITASNITFIPLMYFMNVNIDFPLSILIINMFVMSFILIGLKYAYYNLYCRVCTILIGNYESITMFLSSNKEILTNIKVINSNPYLKINLPNNIQVLGNINDLQEIMRFINVNQLTFTNINQVIITNDNISISDKEVLFNLSKQYKFILLQVCTDTNKA